MVLQLHNSHTVQDIKVKMAREADTNGRPNSVFDVSQRRDQISSLLERTECLLQVAFSLQLHNCTFLMLSFD